MSLDDTVNLERIAAALARLATAFEQHNIICRERLQHEFPPEKAKRAPEVIRIEDERREQFSDAASEEWMRETEAAIPGPSRFQKRFNQTEHPAPAPRRKRTVAVPEVH